MQTRLGMQENIAFWLWNQHASSKCLQFGPQHYFFLLVYFSENYLKLSIFPCFHTPSISFLQGILACGNTSISFLQGVLACGKIEACFDIDLLQHVMSCYKINVVSKSEIPMYWYIFHTLSMQLLVKFFEVWLPQILIRPKKGNGGSICSGQLVELAIGT